MTFNEAKDIFKNRGYVEVEGGQIFDGDKWRQCIVVISEWLKQEPCDDYISRQAVLDLINADWKYEGLEEPINSLPPVTLQPKIGHWIKVSMDKYVQHATAYYKCSECGGEIIGEHNYCPHCGAKMEEVKNEDNTGTRERTRTMCLM